MQNNKGLKIEALGFAKYCIEELEENGIQKWLLKDIRNGQKNGNFFAFRSWFRSRVDLNQNRNSQLKSLDYFGPDNRSREDRNVDRNMPDFSVRFDSLSHLFQVHSI